MNSRKLTLPLESKYTCEPGQKRKFGAHVKSGVAVNKSFEASGECNDPAQLKLGPT